jgi:hypothetical protein
VVGESVDVDSSARVVNAAPTIGEKRWRVYRGPLSGRYFAAYCEHVGNGVWTVIGHKHDVTEDIEALR